MTSGFARQWAWTYEVAEVRLATLYLSQKDMVDGHAVEEEVGLISFHLTDDGLDCAENHGCDVVEALASKQRSPGGDTFHVAGHNVNLAAGSHNQQIIKSGADADLASAVRGLVEIVKSFSPVEAASAEEAGSELVAEIESQGANPARARAALAGLMQMLRAGGNAAVIAACTLIMSRLVQHLPWLGQTAPGGDQPR